MFLNVPAGATGSGTVSLAGFMDCSCSSSPRGRVLRSPESPKVPFPSREKTLLTGHGYLHNLLNTNCCLCLQ